MQELIRELASRPSIHMLNEAWPGRRADLLDEALAIQAIPAPTFEEGERAKYVEQRFRDLGLFDVQHDALNTVYGRSPGTDASLPSVMVSAHLDTVFPAGTDLTTRENGESGRIYGPGLGDNAIGLAAMISLAGALKAAGVQHPADIWWVATVGEEGLGNLRGMRHARDILADRLGLAVIIEGIGISRVYSAGLGVRRLRVSVLGPGGHSWLHADRPNAIHHLLRIGAALVEGVRPPLSPQSTFNIGLIEGGRSINTRAPQASLSIDLRSERPEALEALAGEVLATIARFNGEPDLKTRVEVIGERPCAALPAAHPLVRAALGVLQTLGFEDAKPEMGSTDANILLAMAVPSVCIGITTGGNAHSTEEFIELASITAGMQQLTLLTLAAAEHSAAWSDWSAI